MAAQSRKIHGHATELPANIAATRRPRITKAELGKPRAGRISRGDFQRAAREWKAFTLNLQL